MIAPVAREQAASVRYLLGRLAVLERRVAGAVEERRAHDPQPDDKFRGLYVSDAQIDRLLAGGRSGPEPSTDDPELQAAVESEADRAERAGEVVRLRALGRSFGLESLDVDLLLVALAPDLDRRFERFYGYLNDDVTRRRATIGLALGLCGVDAASPRGRSRLGPGAPLVEAGVVMVEDSERPMLTRGLRVPDRVVAHLLGRDEPPLSPEVLRVVPPDGAGAADVADGAADVARAIAHDISLIYLRDRPGADGRDEAERGVAAAGRGALVVDLAQFDPEAKPGPRDFVREIVLEARLRDAALVVGPVDVLAEKAAVLRTLTAATESDDGRWNGAAPADGTSVDGGRPELAQSSPPRPVTVILHGPGPWEPSWARRAPLLLDATPLSRAERREAWTAELGDTGAAAADLPFRLSRPGIARAADAARLRARAAARDVSVEDVAAGARAGNAAGLERLARRIAPTARWEDLVVPPLVGGQLRELADRARCRERVLDEWHLGRDGSRGRGLTALFAGESGTGKTLAAEVIAADLGLDLYVVDLSTVVDKYIGETEKNLDRIFREATGVNGILLFDEADALFGKRSEVRDARDRYANVEVAYLLQRMESFDGTAILTTNLRANLDEAFTRRLDMLIDLPVPDEAARRRLWQAHLVPDLPVADDLDLDFLARQFRLSGGGIRNAVSAAAHRAAARDGGVTMADLIHGVALEYRKLGRLTTESEFGPYRDQVVAESRA